MSSVESFSTVDIVAVSGPVQGLETLLFLWWYLTETRMLVGLEDISDVWVHHSLLALKTGFIAHQTQK